MRQTIDLSRLSTLVCKLVKYPTLIWTHSFIPFKAKPPASLRFLSKLPGTELGADILFDEGLAAQQQLPR
jgi:hypothetical protein